MQIAIQQVTFPQPGRKFGKLQLTDGQTIWVPPELLGQFRGGMVAEVGTKQQTWGQGADARHVTIVTSTGPLQGGGPGTGQPYGQGQARRPPQPAPQRPNTGFQPTVYGARWPIIRGGQDRWRGQDDFRHRGSRPGHGLR